MRGLRNSRLTARSEEEFFDEQTGETSRVVAKNPVFFQEIVSDEANFGLKDFVAIEEDRFGAFREVAPGNFWRDRLAVGNNGVNDAAAHVVLDSAKMLAESVVSSFPGLRHKVSDVNPGNLGTNDGLSNFRDEQIRDDTGVKRPGSQDDQISLLDGFDGLGERTDAARGQFDFANGNLAARDARFTLHSRAIREGGDQVDVGKCRRKDTAADCKNFAGNANRFGKISRHVSEGREKEIAEIVTAKAAAGVKAILKQTAQQGFILGKSDHAVANVTWGKHAILTAKTAGTATVVGDRDDGDKIADGPLGVRMLIAAADDIFLQTAEKRGKTRAAAKSNDAQAPRDTFLRARILHLKLKSRNLIGRGRMAPCRKHSRGAPR